VVGGQRDDPATLPPGKTRYPLYRSLGGPQGQSGQMRKISPPPGLDPSTVQPVASRYTDWATPAPPPQKNLICSIHSRMIGYKHTPNSSVSHIKIELLLKDSRPG